MKQIIITEEEARIIIQELKRSWIPLDNQKIVFDMIGRIEKELDS